MNTSTMTFRLGATDRGNLARAAKMLRADMTAAIRHVLPVGPLLDLYGYESGAGHNLPRDWATWLEVRVARGLRDEMVTDPRYPVDPACLPVGRRAAVMIELYLRWRSAYDALEDGVFDGAAHSDGALHAIGRQREWKLRPNGLGQYTLVAIGDETEA